MTRTSLNRRILLITAIILVLLVTYVVTKKTSAPVRPIELTHEATSSSNTAVTTKEEIVRVTSVIDGDTIEIEGGRRVRYIGINTPEIAHSGTKEECFGSAARDENSSLVNGKTVRLVRDVSDTDTYGRLLRYVYVGDEFVNETLMRRGFARAEPVKPDTLFASQFFSAQTEAKQENRGLWRACKSSVDTRG
ncbi:MAG: thermonuclease family protein [Candidatus Gottesmanbacteria bacterium]|nr:thermonuclease family protein [Candidatus Gottesmanbacteria bacterium]